MRNKKKSRKRGDPEVQNRSRQNKKGDRNSANNTSDERVQTNQYHHLTWKGEEETKVIKGNG